MGVSVRARANVERLRQQEEAGPAADDDSGGSVWQMDFCSRPIVDERGKKVWELLLCDDSGSVRVSEFFMNNQVNSSSLREAIALAIEEAGAAGVPRPSKVRFFRGQMTTIITRACSDLGIEVEPSRRCETLLDWMQERFETVYSQHEGFDAAALRASEALEPARPVPGSLPEALIAEQWLFVQLPLSGLVGEADAVRQGKVFGRISRLSGDAAAARGDDIVVPGVCVYSRRSSALAAYMMSYDIYTIYPDANRLTLVLGAGLNDLYRFGAVEEKDVAEAEAWEAAKAKAGGVHFLAVAPDQNSDKIDGFWLMQERELPVY